MTLYQQARVEQQVSCGHVHYVHTLTEAWELSVAVLIPGIGILVRWAPGLTWSTTTRPGMVVQSSGKT
jgi:hypothetical protein